MAGFIVDETTETEFDLFLNFVRNMRMDGAVLTAECNQYGVWHQSSIDLNLHIENDNGTLKWKEGGNFASSCDKISIESPALLKATCQMADGHWNWSTLDIRHHITNESGKLKYVAEDLSRIITIIDTRTTTIVDTR